MKLAKWAKAIALFCAAGIVVTGCATSEARAVRRGDIDALREYVAEGGDVNERQRNGKTLLMIASDSGQFDSVSFLLEHGALVGSRDDDGRTALMYAASGGHSQIANRLLDAGADANAQDNGGFSPLMFGSGAGHVQVTEVLLNRGADATLRANNGQTALFGAVGSGQPLIVEMLLQAGADPNAVDAQGLHLSFYGVGPQQTQVLRVLIDYGMDVRVEDAAGQTPLMLAAAYDAFQSVELLISVAPDMVDRESNDGWTAQLLALDTSAAQPAGITQSAQLLRELGAPVPAYGEPVTRVAFAAAQSGNVDVLQVLLEAGIDPGVRSENGELLLTAGTRNPEFVRLLLNSGFPVDATNQRGETPLHIAARQGHLEAVRVLLQFGARPDVVGPDGTTVLMYSASGAHVELMRQLLVAGASVWPRDSRGNTALLYAVGSGSPEAVRLLVTAGADVTASNSEGLQAVDLALGTARSQEIIDILVAAGAEPPVSGTAEGAGSGDTQAPPQAPVVPAPQPASPQSVPQAADDASPEALADAPPNLGRTTYPQNQRSRPSNRQVEINFTNAHDQPLDLVWIDTDGVAQPIVRLRPGDSISFESFAAHRWVFRDLNGNDVGNYMATGQAEQRWIFGNQRQ